MYRSGVFLGLAIATSLSFGIARGEADFEALAEQTGIAQGEIVLRDVPGWRPPKKVVVLDRRGVGDTISDLDMPDGLEIVLVSNVEEARAALVDADAIVGTCSEQLVAVAKNVTWVQIYSAGAERCMRTNRIRNGDVVLTNMQKMASPVIAEHTIAMTLALARRLPQFAKNMQAGDWHAGKTFASQMQSVNGRTMLVVGLGGIGTEVARRAAALDMRIIGTRRSSRDGPEFVHYVGLPDELHALASEADFIVNALPLTRETTGLYDSEFFAAAKKGAYFISVGRGKSVVTDDLVAALESGQVAGAALDVSDPEPLPADHPLWKMTNVLLTPHVAGRGRNIARQVTLLHENLHRFAAGDALYNVVDPELGY